MLGNCIRFLIDFFCALRWNHLINNISCLTFRHVTGFLLYEQWTPSAFLTSWSIHFFFNVVLSCYVSMFKFLLVDTSHYFMGKKTVSGKTIFSYSIEEYMKNSEVNHQRCMSVNLKKKSSFSNLEDHGSFSQKKVIFSGTVG